jgi:hypothetical protein
MWSIAYFLTGGVLLVNGIRRLHAANDDWNGRISAVLGSFTMIVSVGINCATVHPEAVPSLAPLPYVTVSVDNQRIASVRNVVDRLDELTDSLMIQYAARGRKIDDMQSQIRRLETHVRKLEAQLSPRRLAKLPLTDVQLTQQRV